MVGRPHSLAELFQPEMTHAAASSRARLDRFYSNHDESDQLDRRFRAVALEWKPHLSAHRPVLVSRSTPQRVAPDDRRIPDFAIRHPDFKRRVFLELGESMKETHDVTAIKKLQLFKLAVRKVARNIAADQSTPTVAESLEDRLGLSMKLLRSVEAGLPGEVSKCIGAYPKLKELVRNPYDFEGNLSVRLKDLRQHAVGSGAPSRRGYLP